MIKNITNIKPFSKFRTRKRLGQHFLIKESIIDSIVNSVLLDTAEGVLEIGPGLGAITLPIAKRYNHLVAVEKDRDALCILVEKLYKSDLIDNITLIEKDILSCSIEQLFGGRKICIVGNLPYNISKAILLKIINERKFIHRAVFMFQNEVAERLLADPGGRHYGALSVIIQYYATVHKIIDVPKSCFRPVPKVESMVVEIDFTKPYLQKTSNEHLFRYVVRAAFSHRRKTLFNSLRLEIKSIDETILNNILLECNIDPIRRAETLSIDEFLFLTDVFQKNEVLCGYNQ